MSNKKKFPYNFPFKPYGIQEKFMTELYNTLEKDKIGIFESPTGTGKSLSIICSSIYWLLEQIRKEQNIQPLVEEENTLSKEPLWVQEHAKKRKREEEEDKKTEEKNQQENRIKRVTQYQQRRSTFLKTITTKKSDNDDEDLLVNYDDEEIEPKNIVGIKDSLLKDLYDTSSEEDEALPQKSNLLEEEVPYQTPKIIYCSRTHSQLDQFMQEIKKTDYATEIRLVALTSRKKMCIHPKVSKIESSTRLNEVCLDMNSKSDKKCSFSDSSSQGLFKDHNLIKIRDIEELVVLGKRISACPYYGTRKSVPYAHIVVMPYNSLIHKQTREALGIKLENCVVIIDESHNLVESIIHAHSSQVNNSQFQKAFTYLTSYFDKYKNRLKPKNQNRVKQLISLLKTFIKYLNEKNQKKSKILSMNDFLFELEIDNINLFQVEEFIIKSEIAKKLNGFVEKTSGNQESATTCIHQVTSFLLSLTNFDKDGKVHIDCSSTKLGDHFIKFLLLNPNVYFQEIIEKSKSIILAGGTMEPISTLIQQLFPTSIERINRFQCEHVIPDENLLPLCVAEGVTKKFDFTYSSRSNPTMIEQLGKFLVNASQIVPGGVVIFFPSYSYEEEVYKSWLKSGIIVQIQREKKYLREPKSSSEVTHILNDFKKTIDEKKTFKGAVLSCVVGGKMSEGINFSDDYGRCIIVVGLPYPNTQDLELKEKMKYLDSVSKNGGQEYYEGLCMKAVNQSIGRSIRHIKDYSTICLLDQRYLQERIQKKLPMWIQKRIKNCENYHCVTKNLKEFFQIKR